MRKAPLDGRFKTSDESMRAHADLELGNLMDRDIARLQATFVCT